LEALPEIQFFENLEKNCEGDYFFEVLIMNLKNNALAQQKKYLMQKIKKNLS
jgi:hypothetical protein